MSYLALTSYERLRRHCSTASDALTDNLYNKRDLMSWITCVSKQIETYLNRSLHVESRTEYFDQHGAGEGTRGAIVQIKTHSTEYFPDGIPISTVTSVYEDTTGLWAGAEAPLVDYYIGTNSRSIVLATSLPYTAKKSLRVIYTGGLASDGVLSTFAVTTVSGSFTVSHFCVGSTSGAVGIIRTAGATSLLIEVLYGVFIVGESLGDYTAEDITGATANGTATLNSKTYEALCETYPDITKACEMQCRFNWKNKDIFENAGTNQQGETSRRVVGAGFENPLQPEVLALLQPYKRKLL